MEFSSSARRVDPDELADLFRRPELTAVGPAAVAPLPVGHGVRGWLVVARPASAEHQLTDERLRLLEGLSYRVAMALQKARLDRHREQSLHVANALLVYARALARTCADDLEECIVGRAAEMLDARQVSLWLQATPDSDVTAVAARDEDEERRAIVLAATFPHEVAQSFSERPEPFILRPEGYAKLAGAAAFGDGGAVAVAPFALDQGRMGFLVAGAPKGETFGELQLKMLAGLADQATLAISGSR
jgi:hypothetical protein